VTRSGSWTDLHSQLKFTSVSPVLMRLSYVKILPQATFQTKKATLLGFLERQKLFHGKLTTLGPLNVS